MSCLNVVVLVVCVAVVNVRFYIWIIKSVVTLKFCHIRIYYLVLYLAYQPSNHTLYNTYKLCNNLKLPYTKQHVNLLKFTSNMLRLVAGNKQHPWNDFVACNKLLRVWLPLSFMQLWLLQQHTTHLDFCRDLTERIMDYNYTWSRWRFL